MTIHFTVITGMPAGVVTFDAGQLRQYFGLMSTGRQYEIKKQEQTRTFTQHDTVCERLDSSDCNKSSYYFSKVFINQRKPRSCSLKAGCCHGLIWQQPVTTIKQPDQTPEAPLTTVLIGMTSAPVADMLISPV